MTNVKKCEINMTVGNCQKMNRDLKGLVNLNIQGGEMVNLI